MSRRDQVFQALNSVQNHVYEYIDTHADYPPVGASSTSHPSSSTAAAASGLPYSDTAENLPTYGGQANGGDIAPDEILNAPPGQAQALANQLPLSRMARGDARDARRAAAALREEQMKTGQLKKRHTFASSNGRIILDIHSTPQKTLTYMGGTEDRGRGAMKGKVIIHAQQGERVSAIRLKIKAVLRVQIPAGAAKNSRSAANSNGPISLDLTSPDKTISTDKEVLLLQLESKLYSTASSVLPAGATSFDPTLLSAGTHEYPFTIEIPSHASKKGEPLPPSFVLSPLNKSTRVQTSRGSILKALPVISNDWATIKWYAKLTVERPGIFRTNERIFAPFVYLPPPPKLNGIEEQLSRRLRLAMEVDNALRRFQASNYSGSISMESFVEAVSTWNEIHLEYGVGSKRGKQTAAFENDKSSEEKPGLFSRLLFGSQVDSLSIPLKETFTLSLPRTPQVYPLRSGIPFVIHRQLEWKGQTPVDTKATSRVPQVVLFQRVNVYGKGRNDLAGTMLRLMTSSRQVPENRPSASWDYEPKGVGKNQLNRRGESWLGIIDLPPNCTPCFTTEHVTLDYYLSVRVGAGQSGQILHSEPVVLSCPPSRPVPTAIPSTRPAPAYRTPSLATASPSRQPTTTARPKKEIEVKKGKQVSNASRPIALNDAAESSSQRPSALSATHDAPSSSRPGPSNMTAGASSSSSRSRPSNQALASTVTGEKRVLQEHYSNHTSHSRTNSPAPAAQVQPTLPTPPVPPRPLQSATTSRAPSESGTQEDSRDGDSDLGDDPSQWGFHEDELTDLPPSYFEATGATDND